MIVKTRAIQARVYYIPLCVSLMLFLLAGCSLLGGSAFPIRENLDLIVSFENGQMVGEGEAARQVFQPGEPVILKVTLKNTGRKDYPVFSLDYRSLEFYARPASADPDMPLRAYDPVFSPREEPENLVNLEAGGQIERRFLLTLMTFERGSYLLQTQYQSPDIEDMANPVKVFSDPVPFSVEGAKVYARRYLNGLIVEEDAIAIAEKYLKKDTTDSDIRLVIDEMGFYKWQVNLHILAENGGQAIRSFYVCPYQGVVKGEASVPFDPEAETEDLSPQDLQKLKSIKDKMLEREVPKAE